MQFTVRIGERQRNMPKASYKELEEVVKFYANLDNWKVIDVISSSDMPRAVWSRGPSKASSDRGRRARIILGIEHA